MHHQNFAILGTQEQKEDNGLKIVDMIMESSSRLSTA